MSNLPDNSAPFDVELVRQHLLRWYGANARELPWRGSSDPYAIWVSEIMCQQTRVETVREYYARWMLRFPTVEALAEATEDEVMSLWAGLGYYRRARGLHRGAAEVVRDRGGEMPATHGGLRELPGVGDYTAGAIASIAHGEVVPAVDGNVTRVLSRLCAVSGDPSRAAFKNEIRALAASLVEPRRPGDFNQALMELGALVCTPRNPKCVECPLQDSCASRRADTVAQYPPPMKRKAPRIQTTEVLVIERGTEVWVEKEQGDGLLAGTWVFPTFAAGSLPDTLDARFVGDFEHVFSHIRMTYRVHACSRGTPTAPKQGRWVLRDGLQNLGMSTAMRRVATLLSERASE